jgi:hypothetical protein
MKTIMSTLVAFGILAGAANAAFDPFDNLGQGAPYSQGYEQALPRTSNDDYRQALPRASNDDYRDALPLTDATFPDITVATP